jgi:hypothetical protein
MTLSSLFEPVNLVLALAILLGLLAMQQRRRRHLMGLKLCADIFYGAYLTMLGGLSGGLSSLIAAIGALVQTLTPDEKLEKTARLRILLAVVLSIIAAVASVRSINDILPILAVIYCRFIELQKDAQKIRIGFLFSIIPWFYYNYANGFYWLAMYNIFFAFMLMIAIIRHKEPIKLRDPV